jgi:hypothetical protein
LKIWDYDRFGPHDAMGKVDVVIDDLLANRGDFTTRSKQYENLRVVPQKNEYVSGTLSFKLTFRPLS